MPKFARGAPTAASGAKSRAIARRSSSRPSSGIHCSEHVFSSLGRVFSSTIEALGTGPSGAPTYESRLQFVDPRHFETTPRHFQGTAAHFIDDRRFHSVMKR